MPEAGTQLTRQSQELTIFHDVAKALTSSLDLDSILQTIMDKMAEYFRPDTWSLLMVDEKQDDLYFAIAVGDKQPITGIVDEEVVWFFANLDLLVHSTPLVPGRTRPVVL